MSDKVSVKEQLSTIASIVPIDVLIQRAPKLAEALTSTDPQTICRNRRRSVTKLYRALDTETAPNPPAMA